MIRVVAVDDHRLMLQALENAINKEEDMQLVATADHGSKSPGLVMKHHPDVLIQDLGMATGGFEPISSVRNLKKEYPNVKILIFTNYSVGAWVRALVDAGVSGYMLKSDAFSANIAEAIRNVYNGDRYFSPQIVGEVIGHEKTQIKLTPREQSILMLLEEGKSTEVVGDCLNVTPKRIQNMLSVICKKLGIKRDDGVSQRMAAIKKARKLGLLPEGEWDPNLLEIQC